MGAEGRVTRRCPLLSRHIRNLQADGLFCICLEVYTISGTARLLSYFRLARETLCFSAYFIREQRYFISCVILSMRLEAPFGWFAAAMLYHVEPSGIFLLPLLFNMDCGSTYHKSGFKGRDLTFPARAL